MESIQAVKQRFGIIGRSEKLHQALDTAIRVAHTELTVLINGESGSGKEVFSKIIHSLSARKHNQFIAVNCGAIPSGTINSELFGHEKGSFTGATGDRKGYFETVDGGTIFLDEIGEMPLDTQAFLLRVLESGEFIRVGSSKVIKTNVRIIAATNVNLLDRVRKGRFREDLYYRLNTVPIKVPALKERREDILMLFRKFSQDFAERYKSSPVELDEQASYLIENYSWPGNIRELKNVVEQVSVLSNQTTVSAQDLIRILPDISNRNLPTSTGQEQWDQTNGSERDIVYKFLIDMRNDIKELKNMMLHLLKPGFQNTDLKSELNFETRPLSTLPISQQDKHWETMEHGNTPSQPVILSKDHPEFQTAELVDERLSIFDMQKDLITKALKKFNGKRKDAADELGISERTLYRKIKEYNIDQ